jgi:hypothetical protein
VAVRDFCPDGQVTRGQVSVFLERGLNGSTYSPPAASGKIFADVNSSYWSASWIEQAYVDGVVTGCSSSPLKYCPETPVTQAEMAAFLLLARHGASYTPPPATGRVFADVPSDLPAAGWIEQLAMEGITGGCGGGKYCPDQAVTRAEMAAYLVRAFKLP